MFSRIALAKMVDHSLLRPDTSEEDVIRCCEQAKEYHFACVMVLPYWVHVAERRLRDSDIKVGAVIAYPLGVTPTQVKVYEAKHALNHGAAEIDFVANIGAVKSGDMPAATKDIEEVVGVAKLAGLTRDGEDIVVKVIIEVGLTTVEEQTKLCKVAKAVRADFVKTCSGMGPRGVTVQDVKRLRHIVGREMGIKAAGGIRTLDQAVTLINAGASRIGTSTGVAIVDAYEQSQNSLVEEEALP